MLIVLSLPTTQHRPQPAMLATPQPERQLERPLMFWEETDFTGILKSCLAFQVGRYLCSAFIWWFQIKERAVGMMRDWVRPPRCCCPNGMCRVTQSFAFRKGGTVLGEKEKCGVRSGGRGSGGFHPFSTNSSLLTIHCYSSVISTRVSFM